MDSGTKVSEFFSFIKKNKKIRKNFSKSLKLNLKILYYNCTEKQIIFNNK